MNTPQRRFHCAAPTAALVLLAGCPTGGASPVAPEPDASVHIDAAVADAAAARPPGVEDDDTRIIVTSTAIGLDPLVADVRLGARELELDGDRGIGYAAQVALDEDLLLFPESALLVEDPAPATYSVIKLTELDAITITSTTGLAIELDLSSTAEISERCKGPGAYLPYGGSIELRVTFDLGNTLEALAHAGLWPPSGPMVTSDVGVDALLESIVLRCDGA